ncbi:MAG TPA: tetratricopeptide repeat protein [Terriglobales bacterium]|nr:tetratricopeptide repeat protein [Terriglobales bacterium]
MRKHVVVVAILALMTGLCATLSFAQASGTVKGVCRDTEGKPIPAAVVEWRNLDNGRKYTLKTNNKGEYFSLGIDPGKYEVTLTKDGKQIDKVNNFPVSLDEATLDFDQKKNQEQQAAGKGISPEQLKAMQEAQAKQQKEVLTVKQLNEKLAAANQASQAGDFDTAITNLNEATQTDPNRDLLWAKLGDAYLNSANKQTDAAEKTKRYGEAVTDYQKAIDLKQKATAAAQKPNPEDPKITASYYNNLAQAEAKSGKTDDAMKDYSQAAQLNPSGAAQYYYNLGAILTNAGKLDDAIAAFDKAIAADPTKADAYYQKGVNLISKATTDKSGKVIPAPGTEEALNKYLELQPTGPNAEAAKGMLQYIGSSVETTYGKKKGNPVNVKK